MILYSFHMILYDFHMIFYDLYGFLKARVTLRFCDRAKMEEEDFFWRNGRPKFGPHAKTEEEAARKAGMGLPRNPRPMWRRRR